MNESIRMLRPCSSQSAFALFKNARGAAVMDVMGVSIAIPAWRCSVLYQGKKDRQNATVAATSWKWPGKPGWYFRVLNCASEKRLSSLILRAEQAGHTEVGKQLRGALAGHGCAAVGVRGWAPGAGYLA